MCGSVLGTLLFILYINEPITHSTTHHFADDTNILITDKSLKKINKQINQDLKQVCHWLRANKISLNAGKTEIIMFKQKRQNISKHLNFRVSGQKIKTVNQVKYLGINLDEILLGIITT